jgi:hypothetical protein
VALVAFPELLAVELVSFVAFVPLLVPLLVVPLDVPF